MLYFAGLLQSPGQRQAAQAACDRQGQVLQPTGRGEDQGSGRSLRADGITILSVCFCRNKLYKWKLVCVCNFFFPPTPKLQFDWHGNWRDAVNFDWKVWGAEETFSCEEITWILSTVGLVLVKSFWQVSKLQTEQSLKMHRLPVLFF